MRRNYCRRVPFSTSPQASFPVLPLPRVPLGSLLLPPAVGPKVRKRFPTPCEAGSTGWG